MAHPATVIGQVTITSHMWWTNIHGDRHVDERGVDESGQRVWRRDRREWLVGVSLGDMQDLRHGMGPAPDVEPG